VSLHIVSHPDYDADFSPDHRFPMGKYRALAQRLEASGLLSRATLHAPEPASRDALCRAHEAAYVDQVIACQVPQRIEREIGFPVSERVSRRAQLAAGGTLLAARLAMRHGIACNTAGGSHHARRAHGAGFCTFNDVAVAALEVLEGQPDAHILVLDLDVHQGDGTAEILGEESRVFTVSLHAQKNYPVRKVASRLDVGLQDAMEDDAYLAELAAVLGALPRDFDLVFYNAGVDPHRDDRLGRLALSDEGLRARDTMVVSHFARAGVPLCGVIGGGYSRDIEALAARHAILFEVAERFA